MKSMHREVCLSERVDDEYMCERSGIQPSVSGRRIGYRQ